MHFEVLTKLFAASFSPGGFLSTYVNRKLIVIVSLFAMALSMFMVPYCPTKYLFFICGGILGLSCGFYNSSEIAWMIEIWQERFGPFIQNQGFCFSLGTIIPSVILAPYLDKDDRSQANATEPVLTEQSTIHIPFLITGTLNSLAFLQQLMLFIFCRYHAPPMYTSVNTGPVVLHTDSVSEFNFSDALSKRQEPESGQLKSGISNIKIELFAFSILFVGAYQVMEISTMQFLPVFGQYSDLKLSESAAAHILTGLLTMYATGRLIGIIIIFKVRPELILAANLCLIAIGNTLLFVWASRSFTMFWIGTMILGTGFSTMIPSFFTFIEKHLIITGSFASCTMVVGTTTSAMYPIVFGKTIEHQTIVLTYTNFASVSVCVVVMIWGFKLTRKRVARE